MVPYLVAERAPLWDPDGARGVPGVCVPPTPAVPGPAVPSRACASTSRSCSTSSTGSRRCGRCERTGGAFEQPPLWREAAGGLLDRPLQVLDGVEGTALGAAALGLFALGREGTLEAGARVALRPRRAPRAPGDAPARPRSPPTAPLRRSVPGLLAGLGRLRLVLR